MASGGESRRSLRTRLVCRQPGLLLKDPLAGWGDRVDLFEPLEQDPFLVKSHVNPSNTTKLPFTDSFHNYFHAETKNLARDQNNQDFSPSIMSNIRQNSAKVSISRRFSCLYVYDNFLTLRPAIENQATIFKHFSGSADHSILHQVQIYLAKPRLVNLPQS